MADNKAKNTPEEEDHSIEEILSSIRRIISEDDVEEAASASTQKAPEKAAAPQSRFKEDELPEIELVDEDILDDDILELTEVVQEEEAVIPPQQSFRKIIQEQEAQKPAVQQPPVQKTVAPEPEEEEVFIPVLPKQQEKETVKKKDAPVDIFMQDIPVDVDVLSEKVAEEAALSMAKLANKVKETKAMADQPLSQIEVSRITLEEIVRQEVKPIIKDWLDVNLPSLVERIVEREISKLRSRAED